MNHTEHPPPMDERAPSVSVVVPTFARPRELAVCLRSLAGLDYPATRLEVVVVDDGNAEPVAPLVAALRLPLDVTVVRQANGGPARARNEGARRARGTLIAFTDDDCAPAPDWLGALTRRLVRSPGHAIGGRTVNATPANRCATATTLMIDYLIERHRRAPHGLRFLPTSNLMVPAARFREIGGFDGAFTVPGGEDREFCARWLRHGFAITYAPEAVVRHTPAARLGPFLRQHYNYGRGAARLRRLDRQRSGETAPAEPPGLRLGLLRYPFSVVPRREAIRLSALLVLCQLATTAGYVRERAWTESGRSTPGGAADGAR